MPALDFRILSSFTVSGSVERSGLFLGRRTYWKLYSLENYCRVLIHSVLSVELGSDWWDGAVNPTTRKKVDDIRKMYSARPWHSTPGNHDVYYTNLADLIEILRQHAVLFDSITDIDQWLVKLESLRLPRNVVAHMNFPDATDRKRIDVAYRDFLALMNSLAGHSSIKLLVP